jgi:hypothetical protein
MLIQYYTAKVAEVHASVLQVWSLDLGLQLYLLSYQNLTQYPNMPSMLSSLSFLSPGPKFQNTCSFTFSLQSFSAWDEGCTVITWWVRFNMFRPVWRSSLGAGKTSQAESRTYGAEEYIDNVFIWWVASAIYCAPKTLCSQVYRQIHPTRVGSYWWGKISLYPKSVTEGIFRSCIENGEYKQVNMHSLRDLSPAAHHLAPFMS